MDLQDLFSRFAVALGIGLLIGLERGWKAREAEPGRRAAGIRTFAISGLLGGLIAALAHALGGAASAGGAFVLGLGFAAYSGVFAVFCRDQNRAERNFSVTTAIAGMVTFALGAYALLGAPLVAAAGAVATAGLLAIKEDLHGWVERITWPELRSGLMLLAMTLIALPLVPDDPIGPFGGVNPREVWIIAILLASVSFIGYAAVKYFGESRGTLLAGAAGGLASSTAVTVTNARRAAAHEGSSRLLAAGVSLASAVMFLRVCAIVAAINASLLVLVAPTLVTAAVTAVGFALLMAYRSSSDVKKPQSAKFRNPFSFWPVVGFAVSLGVVIVAGRALGEAFGATGAILGAAIVSLADVDAVTVSMARLAPRTLADQSATLAILAAVATDTISKIAIGAAIGRGSFAAAIAGMALACFIAGGLALWVAITLVAT